MLVQASIVVAVISILISYVIIVKKTKTLPQVLTLFILQAIISQIAYALFGLVEDEKIYHATGITLMNSLNSGDGYQNFGVGPGKQSFTYILGTLYFWFGPYPIVGMLVNALILSSVPPILVMACKNLGLSKIARLSSWTFVFMPSLVFWAPGLRRESLAFALIALSILVVSLVYKSRFISAFYLTFVLVYVIQITRQPLLLVLLPGLLTSFILQSNAKILNNILEKKNRIINFYIINFLVVSHSIFFYFLISQQSSIIDNYLRAVSDPKFSTRVLDASWETNSNPLGYIYNIYRAFSGPPIWEWNSNSMVIFGIEGIMYFSIYVSIIWALIKFRNYRMSILVLISCSAPLLLVSSLVLGNYGINSRVRAHYLIPLIPIIALYLDHVVKIIKYGFKKNILESTYKESN